MGKITINELHKSLFDYVQAVSDDKLETRDKTIVGAINELLQNSNNDTELNNLANEISNGKQLIANAIGEPLTAEDSFNEMSSDINNLLSTFKTNMMNNGVTVESRDKFKALIDKIATLADNEGKGIQYKTGKLVDLNFEAGSSTSETKTIDVNFGFIPNIVFIEGKTIGNIYGEDNIPVLLGKDVDVIINKQLQAFLTITSYNSTSITFKFSRYTNELGTGVRNLIYHAIGVGEEDTTLRDSLASILQEEGVSVTEEDDMASLISKVDEEFDRQVVPVGDATVEDVIAGKTFMNNMGELLTGALVSGLNKIKQDSLRTDTPAGKTLVVSATNIGFKPSIVIIFCGNASSICIAIQDELFSSFPLNGYMFTPTYSIGAGYLNALGTSSGDDYYILNNRFKLTIPIHDVGPATVSWIAIGR